MDNGTEFTNSKFREFLNGLEIRQIFASVEHPHANGQAEVANKVILQGLKKRLDDSLGSWADKLWLILWSYQTMTQSSTKEMPFRLTYGEQAVIPVEVAKPSPRMLLGRSENHENMDLVDEVKVVANLAEQALKQTVAKRYNRKVKPRSFQPGDLMLK
ncbi:uncharacterized protein LOC130962503 [Arachis stenosperma]|uniref:uncharacterized protein LOC130962503 n=1 Tax=Arachis stenosperma TaxID=217475 RepID=UPI0025ACE563|nr:uncharacterized protein LOC130962503 [Arachis stenosperma]